MRKNVQYLGGHRDFPESAQHESVFMTDSVLLMVVLVDLRGLAMLVG